MIRKYYKAPKGFFKLLVENDGYTTTVLVLHQGDVTKKTHGTMCVDHLPIKAIRKTLVASRVTSELDIEEINDIIDELRIKEFGHVSFKGYGMMIAINFKGVHKI